MRLRPLDRNVKGKPERIRLPCRFVHVLGDAYPILTDPCLGLSGNYPWAMTFATAAALLTFTLEWSLHRRLRNQIPAPASGSYISVKPSMCSVGETCN